MKRLSKPLKLTLSLMVCSFIVYLTFNGDSSCDMNPVCSDEVNGIQIAGVDGAFFKMSTVSKNRKLVNLINQILAKDKSAVKTLLKVDCGGGAGCYDLGFIFSQLVFKIGEDDFIKLIDGLDKQDKSMLSSFIRAGLEYGYEPYSTRTIENTFPKLNQVLTKD